MGNKKYIKESEARVLIYVETVEPRLRYISKIARKLKIEVGYLIKILNDMEEKQWIRRTKSQFDNKRKYIELTKKAPLEKARVELQ